MAGKPKNNPAEDLMASLLKEVGDDSGENSEVLIDDDGFEPLNLNTAVDKKKTLSGDSNFLEVNSYDDKSSVDYEKTRGAYASEKTSVRSIESSLLDLEPKTVIHAKPGSKPVSTIEPMDSSSDKSGDDSSDSAIVKPYDLSSDPSSELSVKVDQLPARSLFEAVEAPAPQFKVFTEDRTVAVNSSSDSPDVKTENVNDYKLKRSAYGADDKTVAVTGFHKKPVEDFEDKVKVSIGQNRSAYSPGYAAWGGSGSEASLGQAENLRIAQEKILDLEKINETLRIQNEELISASDIIKERSDLLTAQITEYQNDKQNLEESFKNEIALLRGHIQRKDMDLQKAQLKIDDLDSRLKFDMKKIRIRERELENRLELIRAEKNTLTKSKDDQILDLRRKMDIMQMEVDSYRQKCVDLNKNLETNQDSFKRTTRALRLAMANLELQEENKPALKKVD